MLLTNFYFFGRVTSSFARRTMLQVAWLKRDVDVGKVIRNPGFIVFHVNGMVGSVSEEANR